MLTNSCPPSLSAPDAQLLVAYVLMSAYMRLCYVLTTISKTYLLLQQGPCESSMLPGTVFTDHDSPTHMPCVCQVVRHTAHRARLDAMRTR